MNVMNSPQVPLLELDLLKTLVAIADTGNFSSAADAVFRTPSAISMQVKKIEELVGRPIFNRDSRSLSLTPDGLILLEHARRILALNRELVSRFIAPEVAGVVRMGAPDDAAERMLPTMLKRFAETHPCVSVDVVVEHTSALKNLVKSGKLDISIITCPPKEEVQEGVEILKSEKLVWAGLRGGIAFEKRPLPISVWEEGCFWRNCGIEKLESNGVEHRIAFQSANISGQKAAILADLAIAPIPVSSLGGEIVEVNFDKANFELQEYGLGLIVSDNLSEPAKAAADHLRASF